MPFPHIFRGFALPTALTFLGGGQVPLYLRQSTVSRNLNRSTAYLTKTYFVFHNLGEGEVFPDPVRDVHKAIQFCAIAIIRHHRIVRRSAVLRLIVVVLRSRSLWLWCILLWRRIDRGVVLRILLYLSLSLLILL